MKVFLLEDHELPLVCGGALIRTGNLFDPADKHGVAQLTGEVLRSGGTKAKTGDQMDEELENVAASVESQIGETSGIALVLLPQGKHRSGAGGLQGFPDLGRVPRGQSGSGEDATAQRDFAAQRRRRRNCRARVQRHRLRPQHALWLADRICRCRQHPAPGSGGFLSSLLLSGQHHARSVRRFLRRRDEGEAGAASGRLEVHAAAGSRVSEGASQRRRPACFWPTKTDVTQTFFNVGHLGGEFRDKDYPALEVAAEILGGGFSSRLVPPRSHRARLGLQHRSVAGTRTTIIPASFRISGSTQSAHTVDTLKAVREELEKIRTAEVTDEELQTAKDTVLNGFVFHFDRPSKTLNRLVLYEYFGYPRDFHLPISEGHRGGHQGRRSARGAEIFQAAGSDLRRGRQSEGVRNAAVARWACRCTPSI